MKLKKGDRVKVINAGACYTTYSEMAKALKAKKYKDRNPAENGDEGIVRNCGKHLDNPEENIYLVDLGDKEILIGSGGLERNDSMLNKKQALEKIEELKAFIKGLDKEPWKPEKGQEYFAWVHGRVNSFINYNDEFDKGYYKDGNRFETEKEAEMFGLRLASMKQRGPMPEKGQKVWYWGFDDNRALGVSFNKIFSPEYWQGSVKKTKEECEAWFKKYGKSWRWKH